MDGKKDIDKRKGRIYHFSHFLAEFFPPVEELPRSEISEEHDIDVVDGSWSLGG